MTNKAFVPASIISRLNELTLNEIKVLLVLLSFTNNKNAQTFVGREKISQLTLISPSNITRATNGLLTKKFIKKSKQKKYEKIIYTILAPDFIQKFPKKEGITSDTPGYHQRYGGGITSDTLTPTINSNYRYIRSNSITSTPKILGGSNILSFPHSKTNPNQENSHGPFTPDYKITDRPKYSQEQFLKDEQRYLETGELPY